MKTRFEPQVLFFMAVFLGSVLGGCMHQEVDNLPIEGADGDMSVPDQVEDAEVELVECGNPDEIWRADQLQNAQGCEAILGSLALVNFFQESVQELSEVREVRQDLVIHRAFNLKELDGLLGIEAIGRTLFLQEIPNMPTTISFSRLRSVEGRLDLNSLPAEEIAFPLLRSVGGLRVSSVPNLRSLHGFASLKRVEGDLDIFAERVTEEEFLEFLSKVEVTGTVKFNGAFYD